MPKFPHHCRFGLLTSLLSAVSVHGAEPLRHGAADFVPSRQNPIGFRADNNAWYPAATPPLEWWDGRPAMVDGTTLKDGRPVPIRMLGYADQQPKNILWKTRLPSWGEAQPLVVGSRVIVLGEPDLVLCYDAHTGKELWRDRVELMNLPVLGKDRRTLEPAPADAAKRQVVWELARASAYLHRNIRSTDTAEAATMATKAAATWGEWKKLLAANDPRFTHVADHAIAAANEFAAGKKTAFNAIRGDWALLTSQYQTPIPSIPLGQGLQRDLPNNVGSVLSTPVSDGQAVISVFGYGQVACHDLATGKRLWAWRDALGPVTPGGDQVPSPRLWQDIALVRSYAGTELLGIRTSDGSVAWEADLNGPLPPGQGNKFCGNYVTPVLVHLADANGDKVPVLITNLGWAVRPADGAILGGRLFPKPDDKSLSINLLPGEKLLVVENGCGTSGNLSHARMYQLKLTGPDQVTSTLIPQTPNFTHGEFVPCKKDLPGFLTMAEQMTQQIPNYFHGESLAVNERFICGDRNLTTLSGQVRWGGHQTAGYFVGPEMAPVIAGTCLVGGICGEKMRTRSDGACTTPMKVWSLASPLPWLVCELNLVGDATLPTDPIWNHYLKPAGYDLARNVGNDHGIFGFFGNRLGGVVPQGDRLYLQSMTHLYCIGPATKGTPQDDATIVAAIQAEKDAAKLAAHLGAASAQYRFESLRRLRALGAVPDTLTKQLASLIANDPYEEIRAAAVAVMDAAQAGSGTAAFLGELTAFAATPVNWWEVEAKGVHIRRAWHTATLRALGEHIDAALAQAVAQAKPAAQQNLLMLIARAGICGPHLEQAVVTYLRDSKRGREMDVGVLDAVDLFHRANKTSSHAKLITTVLLTQTTGFSRNDMDRRNPTMDRVLATMDLLLDNGQATPEMANILGNLMPDGGDVGRLFGVISRIQRLGKPAAPLAPQLEKLKAANTRLAPAIDLALASLR